MDPEHAERSTILRREARDETTTERHQPVAPGSVLFGEYEVLGLLGAGGMGEVYRARHIDLGSLRAIKVMQPELSRQPDAQRLFHREAQALLEVHHEAVVRCHDLLRGDDGRIYLVMEMVEGPSLSDCLRSAPLGEEDVWTLGRRIASGLTAAHGRGVVHRDLSPDNIVLPGGRPENAKLIDFGIAKILETGDQTVVSGFKGKLAYASPEGLGLFTDQIDARSDLYSLGLVIAAAANGAPLSMGRTLGEAVQMRTRGPTLPRSIPKRIRAEITPLLHPDPKHRPSSAADLFQMTYTEKVQTASRLRRSAAVIVSLSVLGLLLFTARVLGPPSRLVSAPVAGTPAAEPPPVPEEAMPSFASVRHRLLESSGPWKHPRPRVWTEPDPVASGDLYSVTFEADCDCEALLFAVAGGEERIDLVFPNPYEPRRRLRPGSSFTVPSAPIYSLEAVGEGRDTLKLLVVPGEFGFPPSDTDLWAMTPQEPGRVGELDALLKRLERRRWASAEGALRIVR